MENNEKINQIMKIAKNMSENNIKSNKYENNESRKCRMVKSMKNEIVMKASSKSMAWKLAAKWYQWKWNEEKWRNMKIMAKWQWK